MATKRKKFDCVEMKNRIQRQLLAEYEARRSEFTSFAEFINAKADSSPWVRKMRRRKGRPRELAGSDRRGGR